MQFRILGPLEVLDGNRPLGLGGGKQRSLLAILLLDANHVVATDRLTELLWGDEPPEAAGHSLQVYISQLRKLLEPSHTTADYEILVSRPPGYMLKLDDEQLDVRRFERLIEAGQRARTRGDLKAAVEHLRDGLAIWRGQPLADVATETFALPEVARLNELRLRAIEDRIEAELALGRHADLTAELEALVAEHPLRERLCGQLMLALYRSGRQAQASDVY